MSSFRKIVAKSLSSAARAAENVSVKNTMGSMKGYFGYFHKLGKVYINFGPNSGTKIDGVYYNKYSDWREKNSNKSYDNTRKIIMHLMGAGSAILGVTLVLKDVRHHQYSVDVTGNAVGAVACFGCIGYILGYLNPYTLPVIGVCTASISIVNVMSKYRRNQQRLESIQEGERSRKNRDNNFNKYLLECAKENKRPQYEDSYDFYFKRKRCNDH